MTTLEHDSQVSARIQALISQGFTRQRAALQAEFEFKVAELRRAGMTADQAVQKTREQTGLFNGQLLGDAPFEGVGGTTQNLFSDDDDVGGSSPPKPPSLHLSADLLRRRLRELGVANVNQVMRTYDLDRIREALEDYEISLGDGFKVKSPTGYFWSLLK